MAHYRHEIKFFINYGDYLVLRCRLKAVMQPDSHAGPDGQYTIRSLYYDDGEDTALMEKINGVNHRVKYRIRYYNGDTSFIRLEKKTKENGLTTKQSAKLSKEQCLRLLNGDVAWLADYEDPLMRAFYLFIRNGNNQPKTIVEYVREAYLYPAGNVRITFDSMVKSSIYSRDLFDEKLPLAGLPDRNLIILEVKYDAFLPEVIADILQTNERRATAVSKYAASRIYG